MTTYLLLSVDEAAAESALEVAIVRRCAEIGLIAPAQGYGEEELAELRRVRRLIDDLELELPAVEVVLHMRRQVLALRAELRRMEVELGRSGRPSVERLYQDAEWEELI